MTAATAPTELPRTFEEFNEQRRQSFLKVKDFKQAGAGSWATSAATRRSR